MENAFITIYLKKSPVETAKNLMNLAIESNIGDLAALEFIVAALVSKGDITSSMVYIASLLYIAIYFLCINCIYDNEIMCFYCVLY